MNGSWRRRLLRVIPASLVAMALFGLWLATRTPDGGTTAGSPVSGPAPPLVLTDDEGRVFDLAAQRGGVTLVYFGYTACPDVCPTTLAELSEVMRQLGSERDRILQVFVTLDPQNDTASALHEYLANFDPPPRGLTGSPEAIAAAASAWGIIWRRAEGGRFIDHSSVVVVVGPDGRQRLRYGFSQLGDPAAMARDLRRILHEG